MNRTYPASLALSIRADSQKTANGIAHAAAAHLRETFNDDGTLARAELMPKDHTPGAWFSDRPHWTDPRNVRHIYDGAGGLIARVGFATATQSENEAIANADLIASAPRMAHEMAAMACELDEPTTRRNAQAFDVLRELVAYSWLDPTGTECDETFAEAKRRGLALVEKPYPVPAISPRVFDRAIAPELFAVFAGNAQFAIGGTLMCAGPMSRGDTLADVHWDDAGEVENFAEGADVMERICTLMGARFPLKPEDERYPLEFPPSDDDEPPLYVVFKGHAWFACTVAGFVGDLQAGYIEDDGSIDWTDGVVDVDPFAIRADEADTMRRICACLGATYPGEARPPAG